MKRKEAIVTESSCDVLVLQALIQDIVGDQEESLDSLKRVVLNYPKDPSVELIKKKIRAMEFNLSGCTWMEPPDVAQTGGNPNRFSKWRADTFPLKVYIPTDDWAVNSCPSGRTVIGKFRENPRAGSVSIR